jgi:hypothetical protein
VPRSPFRRRSFLVPLFTPRVLSVVLDNKKGAQMPLCASPTIAGGLTTLGDAPSYDYKRQSNKIAHCGSQ